MHTENAAELGPDAAADGAARRRFCAWLAVLLAAAGAMLHCAYQANRTYYAKNLAHYDGIIYMTRVGWLIEVGRAEGAAAALDLARKEEHAVLPYLAGAAACKALPPRRSSVVLLNGGVYLLAAFSLYLLFWRKTGSGLLACGLSLPLLTLERIWCDPKCGLTDLDMNLWGYGLGLSFLSWVLLSDWFRDAKAAVGVGVCAALLALSRSVTFGLLVPALLPLLLLELKRESPEGRLAMLKRLGLAILVAGALCGWWLVPESVKVYHHFRDWYGRGEAIGHDHVADYAGDWAKLAAEFVLVGFTAPLWPLLGAARFAAARNDGAARRLNFGYLWLGLCPVLVLLAIRSPYLPYGYPAAFGLFLFATFPLRRNGRDDLTGMQSRLFRGATLALAALLLLLALRGMRQRHEATVDDRAGASAIVRAIVADAEAGKKKQLVLDDVNQGVMDQFNLCNLFLFDSDAAVTLRRMLIPPRRPGAADIEIAAQYRHYLFEGAPDQKKRDEIIASELKKLYAADYIMAMGPLSMENSRSEPNRLLSRMLLADGRMRRLTGPVRINGREDVILLKNETAGEERQ